MQIVVLVKPVPEAETRLRPNASGTAPDLEGVKWVLAGYDESAVEQALLLKESVPGSMVRAVAYGPAARTEETLRAALAIGCDSATLVEGAPDSPTDPVATSRILASALRKVPFDLLLGGKQAGDDETGVVLPAVGALLRVSVFAPVVDLRWNPENQRFTFQVPVEGGADSIQAATPIAVGLQQAWNDPRTARLPNILKSRRTVLDRVPWADVAPVAEDLAVPVAVGFRLPPPRTGARMIEYKDADDAAQQLLHLLTEEAKVLL